MEQQIDLSLSPHFLSLSEITKNKQKQKHYPCPPVFSQPKISNNVYCECLIQKKFLKYFCKYLGQVPQPHVFSTVGRPFSGFSSSALSTRDKNGRPRCAGSVPSLSDSWNCQKSLLLVCIDLLAKPSRTEELQSPCPPVSLVQEQQRNLLFSSFKGSSEPQRLR